MKPYIFSCCQYKTNIELSWTFKVTFVLQFTYIHIHCSFSLSINGIMEIYVFLICRISPGMPDLIKKLKDNNIDVFLVSGGFRQMIKVSTLSDATLHLHF